MKPKYSTFTKSVKGAGKALAAKPKPRASGTFKPGGELSSTTK